MVILPAVYALQMTASGDATFPKTITQYFSIIDMLARHIGNVETEVGLGHWPNIYCGVAVLMFFLLYVGNRKISVKERTVYSLLLLFFLATFSVNILNFIWHGFHFPNSLPCRHSYIYICLMLLVCYRAYMHLDEMPWKYVVGAFAGAVVFVLLAQKLVTEEDFHFIVFYVAILFLALYLAVIAMYRRGPRWHSWALLLALVVVCVESAVNMAVTSVPVTSRTDYVEDNDAVKKLVDSVRLDSDFFRVKKVTRKTKNDGAWMNFPSVSLFSSTANADLTKLFKRLGCESSTNAYSIVGSTPLVDALCSLKYAVYSEPAEPGDLRTFLGREGRSYLYQNDYVLPLGFWTEEDFEQQWDLETGNPADVQNSLTDALEVPHVLEMVMDTAAEGQTLTFRPQEDGEYYAYVANKKIDQVTATTGKGTKTFTKVSRGYLLELGYCTAGEVVTLTADGTKENLWADVYRFSADGLAGVCSKLTKKTWQLTSWTDTSLEGTIACDKNGFLMTTIPYDRGWKITVDGQDQTPEKGLDAFIRIWLKPGSHTITMRYEPDGGRNGLLISLISIAILGVILWGKYYRRRGENPEFVSEDEKPGRSWNLKPIKIRALKPFRAGNIKPIGKKRG